jgi:hypothetical protein
LNWTRSALLTTLCCAAASAGTITYTETQLGIGSLGGTPFNNAVVTITLTGDTTGITTGGSGVFANIGTATVNVAGIGSGTFTDTIEAVSNQGTTRGGISDLTLNAAILFTVNAGFGSYDLSTAIGPLTGSPLGNPAQSFGTSAGAFILSSANNADHASTFSATLASAPEPGTVGFIGSAITVLLIARRRMAR